MKYSRSLLALLSLHRHSGQLLSTTPLRQTQKMPEPLKRSPKEKKKARRPAKKRG